MQTLSNKNQIDSIQALRAIAAIAVVAHHLPLLGNGAWGVDLFFIISGFIMCYVTETSEKHFFIKRVIRIVPLYWAGTIGVFVIALLAPQWVQKTTVNTITLIKSLAFIPYQNGRDIYPIVNLGWTLNYEMFFYCLFSIALSISHQYRIFIASTMLVTVFLLGYFFNFENIPLRFFSNSIILEFVFGMGAYALYKYLMSSNGTKNLTKKSRMTWTFLGILFIASMPFLSWLDPLLNRTFLAGIPALLAFFCIVYGLSGIKLPLAFILLGNASYSLYLFHPYVIAIVVKLFQLNAEISLQNVLLTVITLFISCVLAILLYIFMEKPLTQFLRNKLESRSQIHPN